MTQFNRPSTKPHPIIFFLFPPIAKCNFNFTTQLHHTMQNLPRSTTIPPPTQFGHQLCELKGITKNTTLPKLFPQPHNILIRNASPTFLPLHQLTKMIPLVEPFDRNLESDSSISLSTWSAHQFDLISATTLTSHCKFGNFSQMGQAP